MTATFDIRAALRTQLIAVSGLPAEDQRKWENKAFTPTVGTPWMRATTIPTSDRQVGTGCIQHEGLFQVDLFYPAESGVATADQVADSIKTAFAPGTDLGGVVAIYRAERARPVEDGDWYMVPVTIYWRAFSIS